MKLQLCCLTSDITLSSIRGVKSCGQTLATAAAHEETRPVTLQTCRVVLPFDFCRKTQLEQGHIVSLTQKFLPPLHNHFSISIIQGHSFL